VDLPHAEALDRASEILKLGLQRDPAERRRYVARRKGSRNQKRRAEEDRSRCIAIPACEKSLVSSITKHETAEVQINLDLSAKLRATFRFTPA
jgi:hypothetical protein